MGLLGNGTEPIDSDLTVGRFLRSGVVTLLSLDDSTT